MAARSNILEILAPFALLSGLPQALCFSNQGCFPSNVRKIEYVTRSVREVGVVEGLLSAKDIAAISYIWLVCRDDEGHRTIHRRI